jgi:MerR family transcriptional regulator, copper efflux regulator
MSNHRLPIVGATSVPASAAAVHVEDELMQVGDLAREAGKTVRAIHLYEEMDLLKPAGRSKGRYRLYAREALVRIRWIGKLQDLGFSLTDIKAIVKDVEAEGRGGSAPTAMVKVREVYKQKLDDTRTQIQRLRTLEREILASLEYLDTCGSSCEPGKPLAECPSCNHHAREQEVPDLVLGFRS